MLDRLSPLLIRSAVLALSCLFVLGVIILTLWYTGIWAWLLRDSHLITIFFWVVITVLVIGAIARFVPSGITIYNCSSRHRSDRGM